MRAEVGYALVSRPRRGGAEAYHDVISLHNCAPAKEEACPFIHDCVHGGGAAGIDRKQLRLQATLFRALIPHLMRALFAVEAALGAVILAAGLAVSLSSSGAACADEDLATRPSPCLLYTSPSPRDS